MYETTRFRRDSTYVSSRCTFHKVLRCTEVWTLGLQIPFREISVLSTTSLSSSVDPTRHNN